jgi:hypothetical protein
LLFIGPVLSSVLSVCLILTIFGVSKLKFLLTARRLHPFDVYEYGSWRNLSYIRDLYPHHYHYVYLALIAAVSVVLVILFFERFVRPGAIHVIGFVVILAASLASVISPATWMAADSATATGSCISTISTSPPS